MDVLSALDADGDAVLGATADDPDADPDLTLPAAEAVSPQSPIANRSGTSSPPPPGAGAAGGALSADGHVVMCAPAALAASGRREIGAEGVWTLSTAKPGNGVEQLRDDNLDTYWQSDGVQPHTVSIQFQKKMCMTEVSFYVDAKLDESYTPKRMSLRIGSTYHDLQEVHAFELEEPTGWITVRLGGLPHARSGVLRAHFLQICVQLMHHSGRDTHIRQIKVHGPRQAAGRRIIHFDSLELEGYGTLR